MIKERSAVIVAKGLMMALVLTFVCGAKRSAASQATLHVYSERKEHLIQPVFDHYTKKTGVRIKYLTDEAGALLQRLKAEGRRTKADLLMTVDAGNLWQAANESLLAPVHSSILEKNIPAHLRDPKDQWFGFSVRARTIVYNTKKIKPAELSTYEDLAAAKWHKRLCLRTSKKIYNQSLVAMMVAQLGETMTERVVGGWVNNLATPVFSDDTAVIKAIAAGQCDAGIVNSYYFGRLMKEQSDLPVALFWPNQKSSSHNRGVHVNISGAGVLKTSRQKKEAQKFLEWLSSEEAQRLFADINFEYPVNSAVAPSKIVQGWGMFKPNLINMSQAGQLQARAIRLMNRARYR